MGCVGVRGEVDGSSDEIGAGFRGVVDFDHEMVVGVIVLKVRVVWIDLLVLFHVYTAPAGYVAAFVEGLVGASGTWWGTRGAWIEAVPACVLAVFAPARPDSLAFVMKPIAIGAITAVLRTILGTFFEVV